MTSIVSRQNGSPSQSSGGTVVNVGATDWVLGLDDPVVDRITRNVLDRLS